MTIDELAKAKANSIPNSKLVKYYEAALPQYHMEVVLTLLKTKKLSVLQEFILKFLNAGEDDITSIRTFLGVNSSVINNAISELNKSNLASVDIFRSKIRITDKGEEALKEAMTNVPEDVEYVIYVDGLLGTIYLDTRKLYSQKDVTIHGLTSVVPAIDRPDLEYLSYEEVKRAVSLFKKNHAFEKDKLEGDLLEISALNKVYVEYKKTSVLVFMNERTNDIELQVYEGNTRNDEYGIALQKLYNSNTKVFEFDSLHEADRTDEHPLTSLLPLEIIESAKEYSNKSNGLEREILSLSSQLKNAKDNNALGNGHHEETDTERIRFLEQKISEMESERKGADRVLSTYDHRPLLIDALKNAKHSVVIISPWIKSSGVNNHIINLIENALQKKTKVIIGYGISEKEDNDQWILRRLHDIKKRNYGDKLYLIKLNNTHEKVLIKDNEFMVITSFNWLSFKGDPKKGFRQETGYYTESKEAISQMKSNLSQPQRLGIEI